MARKVTTPDANAARSARPETPDPAGRAGLPRILVPPVISDFDPVGRALAAAMTSQRKLDVSVRGERIIERVLEQVRTQSHEEISRNLSLDELIEILKVKMYNEAIPDKLVYDKLFGARLEGRRQRGEIGRIGRTGSWRAVIRAFSGRPRNDD